MDLIEELRLKIRGKAPLDQSVLPAIASGVQSELIVKYPGFTFTSQQRPESVDLVSHYLDPSPIEICQFRFKPDEIDLTIANGYEDYEPFEDEEIPDPPTPEISFSYDDPQMLDLMLQAFKEIPKVRILVGDLSTAPDPLPCPCCGNDKLYVGPMSACSMGIHCMSIDDDTVRLQLMLNRNDVEAQKKIIDDPHTKGCGLRMIKNLPDLLPDCLVGFAPEESQSKLELLLLIEAITLWNSRHPKQNTNQTPEKTPTQ